MAATDASEVYDQLRQKRIGFRKFLHGAEGGLDAKSLDSVNVSSLDIRYKVIPTGTKLYTLQSEDRILVFSLNVETLLSILEPNLEEWRDSEELECLRVFEVSHDIHVMQIDEEVAQEVCLLWCLLKDKDAEEDEEGEKWQRQINVQEADHAIKPYQ